MGGAVNPPSHIYYLLTKHKFTTMKKNEEVKNESGNTVAVDAQMEQFVLEHMDLVPRNQKNKFAALSLEGKARKIQFYMDMERMKAESRMRNTVIYRVKEVFNRRNATVQDAKEVLDFCQEFLDSYKQKEIEKLNAEIEKLQAMKRSLED